MKAISYKNYGPPQVLHLNDVEKPVPGDNEVLIKVMASTVNRTDCATIRAIPFFARLVTGLFKPKRQITGTEFAGIVESVGNKTSEFKTGDKVFGFDEMGAKSHAQFMTIKEDKVMLMPDGISFSRAAASSEGAHYAYNFVNKLHLKKGQNALVNGGTGGIGSAAVQLLKYSGVDVTAVCATDHVELVKSLGASKVIDYTRQDFTQNDEQYDFVFDAVCKSSFFKCRHLLKPGGIFISSDLGFLAQNIFLPLVTPLIKPLMDNKKTIFPMPVDIKGSLTLIKKLIEQEQFKAVIDREYPLEQTVEAFEYVEKGHKIGNVVITVAHAG